MQEWRFPSSHRRTYILIIQSLQEKISFTEEICLSTQEREKEVNGVLAGLTSISVEGKNKSQKKNRIFNQLHTYM